MIEAHGLSPIVNISAPARKKETSTCVGYIRLTDPREHDRLITLLREKQVDGKLLNPFRASTRSQANYRIRPKLQYKCASCARTLTAANYGSPVTT